jgi:predicted metalloprotease with PDZ domain
MRRFTAAAVLLTFAAGSASAAAERQLAIRLAPQVIDGQVDAIAVTERFDVAPLPAGARLLSLPMITESVPGVLRDPSTLVAHDAAGVLPLTQIDDPVDPTQMKQDHHWHIRRATAGMITVSYLARPRVITADTKPAALVDMRTEGAGIYGSTKVLFAAPDTGWPRQVHIDWDLSAMAPGSRAVSSFGEGTIATTLDAETLGLAYFMAGPWQKLPADGADGFIVYYLTPPAFDLSAAAQDVSASYRYATSLFGTELQPFRALMRTTERFQGGGGGGRNSFMFGTVKGAPRKPEEVNKLLTHEAMHNWIGSLQSGPDGLWFVEGATEYYATLLPYRIGQRTLAEVAAQIDAWTTKYYANPRRTMAEDAAAAAFWTDSDAQLLPYSRGPLYIALVDARLRAASGGTQRVDALIRSMVEALRRGHASEALWLSLVTQALGEQGKRDFDDLKAGRLLDLPADLFGPCFQRVAGPLADGMTWIEAVPRPAHCNL